jgi:phospholipid transport system substrate-binding protein
MRMTSGLKAAQCTLLILAACAAPVAWAQAPAAQGATAAAAAQPAAAQNDPYKMVEQTTQQVLAIIAEAKGYYDKEPERFHQQVDTVMGVVVDFDSFARGVMGPYANLQRLPTDAEKAQRREQIARFATSFRHGLIETYAKGLLKFNGQRIETLPPRRGDDLAGNSVSVVQNIYGNGDKPYIVQYSMRKNAAGVWKVSNVIIEGINLGQTYRSQFASAADQNRGDVDKVIAGWKVEPQTDGAAKQGTK